jgi:hypothetical protein
LGSVSSSFDRPLPGKPPKIPNRLSPLSNHRVLGIAIQSQRGEGRVTGPALLYALVEKRKIDYNYLKKGERR